MHYIKIKRIVLAFFFLITWSCTDREAIIDSLETEIDTRSIQFKYDKFSDAQKESEKMKRPLLMYFTSDGCGWCLKMERDVFSDTTLQNFINENFICSKVYLKRPAAVMKTKDYKKLNKSKLDFMDLYHLEAAFPTFVIFDTNSKLIKKESKYMDIQEFVQFAKDGL
ncbi:thioredoxin fold domain-containing protein [uncultured Sunxiuqinia sp.]|uniref:thioredoxin family protein n=1 Tax=uncultured Sunxiuqinia sp. TaxID=1573825 RepID=UPI00262E84EF|nr:thioredoxin fold domain-containing protein [uncultured Sunxiuqinia sp.]